MSSTSKQRLTLSNLSEPQQIRELNRQLTWVWNKILGGIETQDLAPTTSQVIQTHVIERIIEGEIPDLGALKAEIMAKVQELVDEGMSHVTTDVIEQMVDDALAELDVPANTGTQLTQLHTQMEGKASAADLNALSQTVAGKASQNDLNNLQEWADGLTAGGRNLLRASASFDKGTDPSKEWTWWHEYSAGEPYGVTLLRQTPLAGFNAIRFNGSDLTADQWAALWSPLTELPTAKNSTTGASLGDWYERKVTFSAYVYGGNWRTIDGLQIQICLSTGDRARMKYGGKRVFYINGSNTVVWGDDIKCDQSIKSGAWRRISVTFALNETDIPYSTDDNVAFAECTHMFAAVYFTRNGHVRLYAPKLEWGDLASDWTPNPQDTDAVVSALAERMNSAETNITRNSTEISTRAKTVDLDTLTGRVTTAESNISQQAGQIASKVSQTDFNSLGQRVTSAESTISQQAGQIASKVSQTDFNSLGQRVTSAESTISQQADQIASKVSQTDFDDLGERVSDAESTITQHTTDIAARVTKTTYNGLVTRVSTAESKITPNAITSTVRSHADYQADQQTQDDRMTAIEQTADRITMRVGGTAGRQMLRRSYDFYRPDSTAGSWRLGTGTSTYAGSNGMTRLRFTNSGATENVWRSAHSPLEELPNGWQGRKVTVSTWVHSLDWAAVDGGISFSVVLSQGDTTRLNYVSAQIVGAGTGAWGSASNIGYEKALRNDAWRRCWATFTLNGSGWSGTGTYSANTHIWAAFYLIKNGTVNLYGPKLEFGETATDWIKHPDDPANVLNTYGGGVTVNIDESSFEVDAPGTDGDFHLDQDGVVINRMKINQDVDADFLSRSYDGPTTLYVNPAATAAQRAAGNYFLTLDEVAKLLSGKRLSRSVNIYLTAGSSPDNVRASFIGISGSGWINLAGNSTKKYVMKGTSGTPTCLVFNQVKNVISISYMRFENPTNTNGSFGVQFEACTYFELNHCDFIGKDISVRGTYGILANRGSKGYVANCEFYDYYIGMLSQRASEVDAMNNRGNCQIGGGGGRMIVRGTAPNITAGTFAPYAQPTGVVTWSGVTVDQGSKPSANPDPVMSTYALSSSDSYAPGNGGWSLPTGNDIMQGYTGGAQIRGCMWFASMSALSGKTITSASLRLYQDSAYGRGYDVDVELWGLTTAESGHTSGAPTLSTNYGYIGKTKPGTTTELPLPTAVISALASGTIKGLAVYLSSENSLYKDRSYSKNYAMFRGSTSGATSTKPLITVYSIT